MQQTGTVKHPLVIFKFKACWYSQRVTLPNLYFQGIKLVDQWVLGNGFANLIRRCTKLFAVHFEEQVWGGCKHTAVLREQGKHGKWGIGASVLAAVSVVGLINSLLITFTAKWSRSRSRRAATEVQVRLVWGSTEKMMPFSTLMNQLSSYHHLNTI